MKNKIVKVLDKALIFILRKINKIHLDIMNKHNLNESEYQFLTPFDKADKNGKYSQALNEALENKKVKNIAISGSYGSGKSSFIKTFELNNPKWNFLDISLATFNKPETDISIVEKSILQQMFYKVETKDIPQSRFKKINAINNLWFKAVFTMIYILSILIFIDSSLVKNLFFPKDLIFVPLLIILYGSYKIIKVLIQNYRGITLDKMNLQSLEISTNKDNESSLLNKYLDEILYFFEKTDYQIVVFQDLDRFENLEIFTKLRELNNFINNSNQVNKRIVFLYAVKDDMFSDTQNNRTKFFDFIIPIIPIINYSNSYEKLLEYFNNELIVDNNEENNDNKDGIEKEFLSSVSLYIEDMRLLKNIYNEYSIYNKKIGEGQDKTKLLAMIIYKNFYPNDFSRLHKKQGLLYEVFNNGFKTIEEKIKKINSNSSKNIKELRMVYILKIIERFGSNFSQTIFVNKNTSLTISESVEDENFNLLKKSDHISYNNWQNNVKFKTIENLVNDKYTYDEREKLISNKLEDNDLLAFLIQNKYINEDYKMYVSYEHQQSISSNEVKFLKHLKNPSSNEKLDFNYQLDNFYELLKKERIRIEEFNNKEILNLYLVDYLIENQGKYPKQIEKLFQQLSNDSDSSKEFIINYIDNGNKKTIFFKLIIKYYKMFWVLVSYKKPRKLDDYFKWIIEFCDIEIGNILELNQNNSLKEYLSNLKNIPEYTSKEKEEKVNGIIHELNIKFSSLHTIKSMTISKFIYKNYHYILTEYMINRMILLNCAPKEKVKESLKIAHFTTINSDKLIESKKILIKHILKNINEYIKNVFLKIDTNTEESEETIKELLDNKDLDASLKVEVVKKQNNSITKIDSVEQQELWDILLEQNKVKPTWENMSQYYDHIGFNDTLIEYLSIENNALELSKVRADKKYCEEHPEFNIGLLEDILQSNVFDIKIYKNLVENNDRIYPTLDISGLDEDKISLLVEHNIFQFISKNFNHLKEYTETCHIELIEKNINDYLDKYDEFNIDTEDLIKLLNSSKITDGIKKDLIEKIDYDLISNKDIAKLIYSYVDKTIIKLIYYTKKMLENLESLESKINLVIEQISEFNNEELIEILQLLPDEYSQIANLDDSETVLKNNQYNKKLIKILYDREFIINDEIEKNKIKLYIKDKEKEIE